MTTDHTTLTDEQIDAFIARVDAWRVRWNTFSGPEYDDLRRACNDIVELASECGNQKAEIASLRKRGSEPMSEPTYAEMIAKLTEYLARHCEKTTRALREFEREYKRLNGDGGQ